MAQPDPRSPKGNRPPNGGGGPSEPTFNWKGLLLLAAAIGLFVLAYVFKNGPIENVVSYSQFVKLLDEDQIVKEKGIDLVSEPGSATDYLVGYKKSSQPGVQPERFKTQVNLQFNKDLQWMLEDKYKIAVSPKSDSNLFLNTLL